MDLSVAATNLEARGYQVEVFSTAKEAADYLDARLDGMTIGFGGSMSLGAMQLYERLSAHNTVFSHLHGHPAGPDAAFAQLYITSANGLAETGEIVNIDGIGNRLAGTLFGHERVIFVIGRNKLAPTLEEAIHRARNIAGPMNARRKNARTPCAVKADHCYDCKSPERICRALLILWEPMMGMEAEVVLVDEDLGF
ncbi:MAG: lactate utilization protein [Oscillibacter sp.]|nr:lactate utilization protein [Oscillibacter sp.]